MTDAGEAAVAESRESDEDSTTEHDDPAAGHGDSTTGYDGSPSGRDDSAADHLAEVPTGAGCTEIWEHLSERRRGDDG